MFAALFWGLTASAGDVQTDSATAEAAEEESSTAVQPVAPEDTAWVGDARTHLDNLVGHETQIMALGAHPKDATVVSTELDWGTIVSNETSTFSRSGLTVRQERLTDGELMAMNKAVDEVGTYDLGDPEERAKLCTRIRTGATQRLNLHAWSENGDAPDGTSRSRTEAGFVLLDDDNGSASGMVRVYRGDTGAVLYQWRGDASQDEFGKSVANAGDVNSDGVDDVIVGAPQTNNGGFGYARIFSGATGLELWTLLTCSNPSATFMKAHSHSSSDSASTRGPAITAFHATQSPPELVDSTAIMPVFFFLQPGSPLQ